MTSMSDEEKQVLIDRFQIRFDQRLKELEERKNEQAEEVAAKVRRRLEKVLRKMWDVKIRDVINMEREQTIELATLFQDLEKMKSAPSDA